MTPDEEVKAMELVTNALDADDARLARLAAVARAAQEWRDERVVGAISQRQRDLADALAALRPGDIPPEGGG